MADKGKGKLPPEESSSFTRRHRRERAGAQVSASARTERVPQPSMTAEEQEQDDLFTAQLMSMVGTFEQLVKNPRMRTFLKSRQEDTQAESSRHVKERSQRSTSIAREHVDRTPHVTNMEPGPVQQVVQAHGQGVNGQGSNAQQVLPTISPQFAAYPGYFGGGVSFPSYGWSTHWIPGFYAKRVTRNDAY